MVGYLLLLTAISFPCAEGVIASVDGLEIAERDLSSFKRIEKITGLNHTNATGLLGMLERRSYQALAARTGLEMGEADYRLALEEHLRTATHKGKLVTVFREVGEDRYRKLFIAPRLAESRLTDHYTRAIDADIRKRTQRLLSVVSRPDVDAKALAERSQGQIRYARFRLSPKDILHHLGEGIRGDYESRLERYRQGLEREPPPFPSSPVEHVYGLGYGNRGYVQRLSDLFRRLDDGEWSRDVIRDEHQWMVLRRLSRNGTVYEGEGLTIVIPEFNDWIVSRYRELEIKICSQQLWEDVRREAPTNAFVELIR